MNTNSVKEMRQKVLLSENLEKRKRNVHSLMLKYSRGLGINLYTENNTHSFFVPLERSLIDNNILEDEEIMIAIGTFLQRRKKGMIFSHTIGKYIHPKTNQAIEIYPNYISGID